MLGLRLFFTRIAGTGFDDDAFSGDRAFLTQIEWFEDMQLRD